MNQKRIEAIAGLENALNEIESGEGLSTFVEGHGTLSVSCDDDGAHYEILAEDGSVIDAEEGWSGLASRLESVFGDLAEDLTIIWP